MLKKKQKRVGLIGGATWHSSIKYYELINKMVAELLGNYISADLVLWNLNFANILEHQKNNTWAAMALELGNIARLLENSGCLCLVLCSNTLHKVVPEIQEHIRIPIHHICDSVAKHCLDQGIARVGLLGTRFTMNQRFYADALRQKGVEVVLPCHDSKVLVDDIIFRELAQGNVTQLSRDSYLRVCTELQKAGVDAVLLGCTEIGLLLKDGDHALPLLDTTQIHAQSVAQWMVLT